MLSIIVNTRSIKRLESLIREWPEKIYTVSYTLYPLIGLLVTVIVATVVSLLTGPTQFTKKQEKFTHSWIVSLYRLWRKALGTEEAFEMDKSPQTNKIILNGMGINMTDGVIPSRGRARSDSGHDARRRRSYDNPGFQKS